MLLLLASMNPHPESVPVNGLVAVEGGCLEEQAPFEPLELVRMVATARILMPHARVRLSAGRESMSREAQILCLQAGADSIFYGDVLLGHRQIRDVEADRRCSRWCGGDAPMGMEACVTAGMLTDQQAERLAGRPHRPTTTTSTPAPSTTTGSSPPAPIRRLETLQRVRKAVVTLCCGGIIGMGETLRDRASMLQVLASMNPHPESVPVNGLVVVEPWKRAMTNVRLVDGNEVVSVVRPGDGFLEGHPDEPHYVTNKGPEPAASRRGDRDLRQC